MKRKSVIKGAVAALAMSVLILDTDTAFLAASDGIELCIRTIIPSLFPFFVLSGIISACLICQPLRVLRPVGRFCKIPPGTESLLLLGLLAGYPVGAQLITQAYKDGTLSKGSALRMLGFCNNTGPSFIFGILSPLFTSVTSVWALWGIHILSAVITGALLPIKSLDHYMIQTERNVTASQPIEKAIKSIAVVCSWVVIFRVILGFCKKWILWKYSNFMQVLFLGLLELANGCVALKSIENEASRFFLAAIMLSFGGLCVGMQTTSVTKGLGTGFYFPGKILQTILTALLCALLCPLIF